MSQQPLRALLADAVRKKQILEQLMATSTALLSGRGLQEVLDIILQGVQAIGFDRVCLYLLSEDRQMLEGQAQVNIGTAFVGHKRPVAADIYMQTLLTDPRPHVFERDCKNEIRQILGGRMGNYPPA
jgi:hypothetical protein